MNVVVSSAGPKLGRLTLVSFVESRLTVMRAVGIVLFISRISVTLWVNCTGTN